MTVGQRVVFTKKLFNIPVGAVALCEEVQPEASLFSIKGEKRHLVWINTPSLPLFLTSQDHSSGDQSS